MFSGSAPFSTHLSENNAYGYQCNYEALLLSHMIAEIHLQCVGDDLGR